MARKTHVMKSVRSSGCQMTRVMSSLLMMSTPPLVRKTRQTSIAAYLMQPKKAKSMSRHDDMSLGNNSYL